MMPHQSFGLRPGPYQDLVSPPEMGPAVCRPMICHAGRRKQALGQKGIGPDGCLDPGLGAYRVWGGMGQVDGGARQDEFHLLLWSFPLYGTGSRPRSGGRYGVRLRRFMVQPLPQRFCWRYRKSALPRGREGATRRASPLIPGQKRPGTTLCAPHTPPINPAAAPLLSPRPARGAISRSRRGDRIAARRGWRGRSRRRAL